MSTLAPLHISHLAYEVLQAGYWFRVDGDRLYVTARFPNLPPLPQALAERVRAHRAGLIKAVQPIPPGCSNRPGHLYAGRCTQEIWQYLEVPE